MSIDALQSQISSQTFRRIYFFYGEEPYLKRFYMKSLVDAVVPQTQDTDLHRYEGKTLTEEVFSEELQLFPLGEYKVLLIYDLPLSSPVTALLSDETFEIPEDTVVILYQQTEIPDSRTKTFKQLKTRLEKDGLLLEIKTVDDSTLARWVTQQFRRRECTVSPENVAYFLSVEEKNMESMLTEIEKISAYCHGEVTRDALEKLCVKTLQAQAYELSDLVLAHKPDEVFSVLKKLQARRTQPQPILGALFSCFGNLYKLKELEGYPEEVRLRESELRPFVFRRYSSYVTKIPLERLDKLMEVCAEIDLLSKTSSADGDLLVVRLLTAALELL